MNCLETLRIWKLERFTMVMERMMMMMKKMMIKKMMRMLMEVHIRVSCIKTAII